MVDCVVVDPDQKQTTETLYDPAISGEIMRPWDSFSLAVHGVEKVIARAWIVLSLYTVFGWSITVIDFYSSCYCPIRVYLC